MSDSVRPEITAFRELEQLVHHLADELAGFRRRALLAESRLRDLESHESARPGKQSPRMLADRCAQLEKENASLKGRLEAATTRTSQMLDRVRFIRQQTQSGTSGDR
jgi:hypothetical protein